MRVISIKKVSDLPVEFKDIVSLQIVDNKIEAVTLKVEGKEFRVTAAGTYTNDLKILVPQPQIEIEKYKLVGTLNIEDNLPFTPEIFDSKSKVEERLSQIRGKYYDSDLQIETLKEYVDEDKV